MKQLRNLVLKREEEILYMLRTSPEAILIAAESNKTGNGEVLNIGSGKATTVEDVWAVGGEITFIPRRKFEVEHILQI